MMHVRYTTTGFSMIYGGYRNTVEKRYKWRWFGRVCILLTNAIPPCHTGTGVYFKSAKEIK